ncbi:hypothetical protein GO003_013280 [Methylicorpusculum oleiharenae]|uniref:esterase/lipase family protein n=1 Tax=Methylicorpusculum oleiharenae TaxID=1338687 RepID=UPI0013575541|nr:hypothetical protein [Methylicorpusculum oleiharenae]MCD2451363.1 hypothetical protein [Methylicorpusculum oleiharenae]
MDGKWIKEPKVSTSVVFVHGIMSSGDKCWQNKNGIYWPEILCNEEDLSELGIYVYSYQTSFTSGQYNIGNVVDDLKERLLNLDNVIGSSSNIIFVCHSMGGIIVRKFIVERAHDLIDRRINIGLFMVASPTLGSKYANWLEPIIKIAGHEQAKALKLSQNNQWLNDLDKTFLNLKESNRLEIHGKELIEDKFITLKKLHFFKQVVEPFSGARYFAEPIKIPNSDHSSIAKPDSARSLQHRLLCTFIKDSINLKKTAQQVPVENLEEINFVERYLRKRLEESLSSFSSQPKVWVDPVLSRSAETSLEKETNSQIYALDLIKNPTSTIIKAPPQFGLTCLAHYLILSAWNDDSKSLWLYLDATKLKPHKSAIEKATEAELDVLGKHIQDIKCVVLDAYTGEDENSINILQKVISYFSSIPIIVMNTINDTNLLNNCNGLKLDQNFNVLYLWSLSRSTIRRIVTDYNNEKSIGVVDTIVSRVISDFTVLNIPRTPLNCLTLLKVLEIDFQENPVNRAEVIQRVLFLLFNVDEIPDYKSRPDLKDCEHVLGYFCETLLKENKFFFSRDFFIKELTGYCQQIYIDLDIDSVFDVLFVNNIVIRHNSDFKFKYAYWVYYFLAQRMSHSREFADYILENMRYTKFPEVIEFYTGIDRQKEDALRILIKDIRCASDKVRDRCGLPTDFNPFRLCKWQASPKMLEKMHDEIANGVQESNLPESIKDSYADQNYDRARPYNQDIMNILDRYSYLIMIQAMKAGSRALRNSDYVDPDVKKQLLQEIMKCWEEISKVLIVLTPFLAEEGYASFQGQGFTLRGNFGDSLQVRLQNILFAIPFNIVNFNRDDLFSQRMGPLLISQLNSDKDELKKHILSLLLIHQRPRNWRKEIEKYIISIEKDSFYLFDTYNSLRTQYKYSFANDQTLTDIEYLIKLSAAKHASGRTRPGEKQLRKVNPKVIPARIKDRRSD